MRLIKPIGNAIGVVCAAAAGTWVGAQLRSTLTGDEVQSLRIRHTTAQGHTITNTPVATQFYPALLAAGLGRPRWLYAFIGGVAVAALWGDRLEHQLCEKLVDRLMSSGGEATGAPT